MAKLSVAKISITAQELNALTQSIQLSIKAFNWLKDPFYLADYLKAIQQIVQLGAVAVLQTQCPLTSTAYSQTLDTLADLLRDIDFRLSLKRQQLEALAAKKSG